MKSDTESFIASDVYYISQIVPLRAEMPVDTSKFAMQHGLYTKVYDPDLAPRAKMIFTWNTTIKKLYEQVTDRPVYSFGTPYVHFRKAAGIHKSPHAKGTIVFPSHSCFHHPAVYDIDAYCKALINLPKEFHPITVCVFWNDVVQYNTHLKYAQHGFEVTSVMAEGLTYVEGFYNILKNFAFSTSNSFGTHALYSLDMDIPFFLYGESATYDNTDGRIKTAPTGVYPQRNTPHIQHWSRLFRKIPKNACITAEQHEFAQQELGMHDCLTKEELQSVLAPIRLEETSQEYAAQTHAAQILATQLKVFKEAFHNTLRVFKHKN